MIYLVSGLGLISPRARAVLAILATVLMWASSFVLIRAFAAELSPGPLGLIRLAAGSVTLTLLVIWVRRGRLGFPGQKAFTLAAAFGLIWFALYTLVFNGAGHFLDAGTIAMLVNLAPLVVALGAGVFFAEGFPRQLFAGMAVSLVGILLITIAGRTGELALSGILIALLAAVLYAAGMLVQKVTLMHTDPLTATWIACLTGTVALLPFAGQTLSEISTASTASLTAAVYMGIGPTALAFWCWGYAMTQFPAGRVAASTLSVPAVVVIMSAIALRELPPPIALVGGGICLIGVAIAQWRRSRPRPVEPVF